MVAIQLLYCSLAIPILRSFIWENEEFDMPTTVFVSSEGCQGRFDRNRPWRPGSVSLMKKQRDGRLIIMSNQAGIQGIPFHGIYSASKFAVEGFMECIAPECLAFNI